MEAQQVIHLSYAGFYSGRRLCGVSPTQGPRAIYALTADARIRDAAEICPKCRAVWDRELEENE